MWDEPTCFKELNLKPGLQKKFDVWLAKSTKKYAAKCATWKKGKFSINGAVKAKEKCFAKSYGTHKFQKCKTFYTYNLCQVKTAGSKSYILL